MPPPIRCLQKLQEEKIVQRMATHSALQESMLMQNQNMLCGSIRLNKESKWRLSHFRFCSRLKEASTSRLAFVNVAL